MKEGFCYYIDLDTIKKVPVQS